MATNKKKGARDPARLSDTKLAELHAELIAESEKAVTSYRKKMGRLKKLLRSVVVEQQRRKEK